MRGSELLARGTAVLNAAEIPDAGRDARRLLAFVLKVPPGRLTLFLTEPVSDAAQNQFDDVIARRAARVPISHLTGRRQFYGREFLVTPDVLDPRPETETLIEAALAEPFSTVLDLGTGSGCIVLTLLAERSLSVGAATDISASALGVAYWNRNALSLEDRAALYQGDWFDALPDRDERFDLIVSNPPYIAASEMSQLQPEVREHEPRIALTDEGDGLAAYRCLCAQVAHWLEPGGRFLVEIGHEQGADVSALMFQAGLTGITVIPDLDGRDRVVIGRKNPIF